MKLRFSYTSARTEFPPAFNLYAYGTTGKPLDMSTLWHGNTIIASLWGKSTDQRGNHTQLSFGGNYDPNPQYLYNMNRLVFACIVTLISWAIELGYTILR